MDIAPWLGEKLYPFSHLLGYRRRQAHRPDEPMVAKQWRSKAWVKKAEHIVQTFVGALVVSESHFGLSLSLDLQVRG